MRNNLTQKEHDGFLCEEKCNRNSSSHKGPKEILKSKCCLSPGCSKYVFLVHGSNASPLTRFVNIFDKPGPSFLLAALQMRQVFRGLGFYCECFAQLCLCASSSWHQCWRGERM